MRDDNPNRASSLLPAYVYVIIPTSQRETVELTRLTHSHGLDAGLMLCLIASPVGYKNSSIGSVHS